MEKPLAYLEKRVGDNWLIADGCHQFNCLVEQFLQELTPLASLSIPPKILLAEREPVRFLAGFMAATAAGCPVFLCNPDWVKSEWQQVFALAQPDLILGQEYSIPRQSLGTSKNEGNRQPGNSPIQNPKSKIQNSIMIPTGGSSGQIRFAIHTWETLMSSVRGFQEYFHLKQINSFCVLPLYHVSGLMQFMRSLTTGGRLAISPFKGLPAAENCDIDTAEFFISLVPTQLQRLLHLAPTWLSRFQTVLLGGAPAWAELLELARHHGIRLAPTYGMTETASQIVTLKPEDFLDGNNSCGKVLPHAQVTIRNSTGEILAPHQTGIITIAADSLALGYYPPQSSQPNPNPRSGLLPGNDRQNFQVDDLGFFDEQGYLHIVGRSSNKIITGGENVFPSEVESAILSTQLVADVCALGLPDRDWGQVVAAVYVPISPSVTAAALAAAISDKLTKFKRPKYWIPVASLPRNSQGKVNREQLQQIAMTWQQHHPTGATTQ
jgi:O-succinylbenzoic acid--CoA ligase